MATGNGGAAGAPPTTKELVAALVWARTQPKAAAAALRERLKHFQGKDYRPPERNGVAVVTKEGPAVVHEAIAYLEALEPLGTLASGDEADGLDLAAEDHVADIGSTGQVSHSSSDGSHSFDRAQRYGCFKSFGECLWYGSRAQTVRGIVLDLLIDDGVESRGHRLGVCNPAYEVVGAAYGPHRIFGFMAAFEFAAGWQPNKEAVARRRASGPVQVDGQEEARKHVATQWKSLGGCAVCGEQIRGGSVIDVEKIGGKVHAECFSCSRCRTALRGAPWMPHERKPYCKACYFQEFGDRCTACSKPIDGAMMKCSLGVFHIDCVVCGTCGKHIGKGSFTTALGAMACASCSSGAANTTVRLGGTAKAKAWGARPGSGPGAAASPMRQTASAGFVGSAKTGVAAPLAATLPAPKAKASAVPAGAVAPLAATLPAPKAKAKAGAKGKAQAKGMGKMSLAAAGATVVGLGDSYADF